MALRLLLLFVFAYLVLLLFKLFLSWRKRVRGLRPDNQRTKPQDMVLDPQCQSYVPKGDAVLRGGHYFCSEDCARVFLVEHS